MKKLHEVFKYKNVMPE